MSLRPDSRFRPLLVGVVTAVVVGGSGAVWAANGLLGSDYRQPTTELPTGYSILAQPTTEARTQSEAESETPKRKKNGPHRRPTSGPSVTAFPSRSDQTAAPAGPSTQPPAPDDTATTHPATSRPVTTDPASPGQPAATTEPPATQDSATTDPTTGPTADPTPTDPETEDPTTEPDPSSSPADPTTGPTTPAEAPTSSSNTEVTSDPALASQVIGLVNEERAEAGCDPVAKDEALTRAAVQHSERAVKQDRLAHQYPGEPELGPRLTAAGYTGWRSIAENIASTSGSGDAQGVVQTWMSSAGHKANILNCDFTQVGVAATTAANGTVWWTQDFGARF